MPVYPIASTIDDEGMPRQDGANGLTKREELIFRIYAAQFTIDPAPSVQDGCTVAARYAITAADVLLREMYPDLSHVLTVD